MKLNLEEIEDIAYYLDTEIERSFHDACLYSLSDKYGYDFYVSDEDVAKIKEKLKSII